MKIDLTALEKAVAQLEKNLYDCDSDAVRQYPEIGDQMRAGAIKAFEFTYGLSTRMIQRYLEQALTDPKKVEQYVFRDLIRMASEQGLLQSDLKSWVEYRRNRELTSHVYDQEVAEQVFRAAHGFLDEVRYLLAELQKRNEQLG